MREIINLFTPPVYEPEPAPVLYRVEPIILGPDGWMVFENPSPLVLERRFAGDEDEQPVE